MLSRTDPALPGFEADSETADTGRSMLAGMLPSQGIRTLIERRQVRAEIEVEPAQIQPASLDLRLGRVAYRVRASFLPGKGATVAEKLAETSLYELPLEGGAVLEKGCVYLVPVEEMLALPDSISALANPKSSTGRLDVFTRLIADRSDSFDAVPKGYRGQLYVEVSPRTFSIRVRRGTRLNQLRFRRLNSQHLAHHAFRISDRELAELHQRSPLVDEPPIIREGLNIRVNLRADAGEGLVGYRALRHTGVIDLDQVGAYDRRQFWEPIIVPHDGRLILEPNDFYILASRERLHIPNGYAAEMVPFDPMMGEFRVHYAGFFDPGFGWSAAGAPGSRAVLEVRSHDVPFILEDGQTIGRLMFERLTEAPAVPYGQGLGSNYQGQGLKLSKHFR